jgi:hypothetical protein
VRQLFSLRFVAALVGLAAMAFVVSEVVADDDDGELRAVVDPEPPERVVDIVEPVRGALPSDDFAVDEVTTGYVDLLLDRERVVRINPGTPGELTCEELDQLNRCAIFADVLGDAVVWFAIVPQGPRSTAEVPEIVDLEEGRALLANGWRLPYAPVIDRSCGNEDIASFQDFLRRFGEDSITTVDLTSGEVVSVRCAADA